VESGAGPQEARLPLSRAWEFLLPRPSRRLLSLSRSRSRSRASSRSRSVHLVSSSMLERPVSNTMGRELCGSGPNMAAALSSLSLLNLAEADAEPEREPADPEFLLEEEPPKSRSV